MRGQVASCNGVRTLAAYQESGVHVIAQQKLVDLLRIRAALSAEGERRVGEAVRTSTMTNAGGAVFCRHSRR